MCVLVFSWCTFVLLQLCTSEFYSKACGVGLSCTCSHLSIFTIWYCGLVCCSVVTVHGLLPTLQLLLSLPCSMNMYQKGQSVLLLKFPQVSGEAGHCVCVCVCMYVYVVSAYVCNIVHVHMYAYCTFMPYV